MKKSTYNNVYSWFIVFPLLAFALPIPTSASLLDGLVAYYSLNGNANDLSGNGNDGTIFGATLTTDRIGNPNSAYYFNGIDNYIDIGTGVKPNFPLTVGLWVNADTIQEASVFRNDTVNHASNRYGLDLRIANGGVVYSNTYEGFSAPWNRISHVSVDPLYSPGEWHHYAVVFNAASDRELYWDGVLVNATFSGTGSGMLYSGGSGALGIDAQYPLLGSLDNITVHNRSLSSLEIQDLMDFNVPIPSAVWLFGSGLLGMVGIARRKKTA